MPRQDGIVSKILFHPGASLCPMTPVPPAAIGTVGESRVMRVPMGDEIRKLLQPLDRGLALSHGHAVSRERLVATALEMVLADPGVHTGHYPTQHNSCATWKHGVQTGVPVDLADQIPRLRYTGEYRQSTGVIVSIAVGDLLKAVHENTTTAWHCCKPLT
jgi:hypothetical protein